MDMSPQIFALCSDLAILPSNGSGDHAPEGEDAGDAAGIADGSRTHQAQAREWESVLLGERPPAVSAGIATDRPRRDGKRYQALITEVGRGTVLPLHRCALNSRRRATTQIGAEVSFSLQQGHTRAEARRGIKSLELHE